MTINRTHDVHATSWVASADYEAADFPIQNLPFSVFRRRGSHDTFRGGVAIGRFALDLAGLAKSGLLEGLALQGASACAAPTLDSYMAMGPKVWSALRERLFDLLSASAASDTAGRMTSMLAPLEDIEYAVPTSIGDYTDFYTSVHHAINIGKLFGIDKPSPNFYSMPIAYHGRSSTITVSGERVVRPMGQMLHKGAQHAVYEACRKLDYELELGVFVGPGNARGTRIPIDAADEHIFGICLLNDWSARDLQAWEMHPLGPFHAKNFATTLSPWIVTREALEPFRVPLQRDDEPEPMLPYLDSALVRRAGAFDIRLEVWLQSDKGRQLDAKATRLAATSFRHQYWTVAQMLAHHTAGGCAMRPGDLFGTGTISGPSAAEAGAIMELTQGGARPVAIAGGETREFLQDGDVVTLQGWCVKPGFRRIGFGECTGEIAPAQSSAMPSSLTTLP